MSKQLVGGILHTPMEVLTFFIMCYSFMRIVPMCRCVRTLRLQPALLFQEMGKLWGCVISRKEVGPWGGGVGG